mmetsp:Transcript_100201/g.188840  ORF Transcript_100201/g.188840 Transcript_100201/m.188840 type:complete len:218 (-) Transcript_100201:68-721(-)
MAEVETADGVTIEEIVPEKDKGGDPVSVIQASREKAKDLSYYHAHGPREELPPEAVIREDDPLFRANGRGPVRVEEGSEWGKSVEKKDECKVAFPEKVQWIEAYSFSDEGKTAKIYIEFPEVIKDAEIQCEFDKFSVALLVRLPGGGKCYGLRIKDRDGWILEHERSGGFEKEVVPEKCKYRVSSNGQRITLTLAKLEQEEKWMELKKKDVKSTIPR